jgi:hypothetical protein
MSYSPVINKFTLESKILFTDNSDNIDISKYIKSINVYKNYVENVMPLYIFNLNISQDIKNELQTRPFMLSAQMYSIDVSNKNEDYNVEKIYDKLIFNIVIREYDKTYSDERTVEDKTQDENVDEMKGISYVIQGIPDSLVSLNSGIYNNVFANCNVIQAIKGMLSYNSTKLNLIYDKNPNNIIYENVIIPPYNLIPIVRWIDNTYNIYDEYSSYFLDDDGLHIYRLSFNRDIKNFINIEIMNTNENDISVSDDDYIPNVDEDNNIKMITNVAPMFSRKKRVLDDSVGTKQIYNSYDNLFNLVQRTKVLDGYEKTRVYWNSEKTIYSEDKFSSSNFYSDSVSQTIRGINPNLIDMNSLLNIKGNENNNYVNGEYLITSTTVIYSTDNYDTYDNVIIITGAKKD